MTKCISYMYTYIPYPLPPTLQIPPLWVVTQHWADLPVWCNCFPIPIYFMFGGVYMSMSRSHNVQAYSSPSCVLKSIIYVCVFIPVLSLDSSEPFFIFYFIFFRFHIYVLAYGNCFSLSDLLHSVWQTLGPSTSLQITQFHFFLWLSNIPLYICATSSLSIHLSMNT